MQNQIYRLEQETTKLEFWIADTNEGRSFKEIKEIAITIFSDKGGNQTDYDLDEESIKSLIKYLQDSLEFISKFNKESPVRED